MGESKSNLVTDLKTLIYKRLNMAHGEDISIRFFFFFLRKVVRNVLSHSKKKPHPITNL